MAKDNLKELPPEERIKKLRELELEKKKEIEEAKKLIKESEEELTEQKKWLEKVPIPQVAREDLQGLSEAEKEILKVHRSLVDEEEGEGESGTEEETAGEGATGEVGREGSLEETVSREEISISDEAMQAQYGLSREIQPGGFAAGYVAELSREPMRQIEEDVLGLYDTVREKGYMSREEQQFLWNRIAATEEKFRAYREGTYPTMSQETAQQGSLALQLGSRMLHNQYQASTPQERTPQEMYKASE